MNRCGGVAQLHMYHMHMNLYHMYHMHMHCGGVAQLLGATFEREMQAWPISINYLLAYARELGAH